MLRYMDKLNGIGPKLPMSQLDTEEAIVKQENQLKREAASALCHADYIKCAQEKLAQLMKHCKLRHEFDDSDDDFRENGDSDDSDEDD